MKLRELLSNWMRVEGVSCDALSKETKVPASALSRFLSKGKISDLHVTRLVAWCIDERKAA